MAWNTYQTGVESLNVVGNQYQQWTPFRITSSFVYTSATNLVTYFVMQGLDTISNTTKTWTVQDTPDPTALRFNPGSPSSVSIAGAYVIDRYQA